ncbi:MAG TPA: Ig-like domain repeat protein [Terriglobales bacterium]|jgi:subtilase family serine protease
MGLRRFSWVFVFLCFVCSIPAVSFAQYLSPQPLITQPIVESNLVTLKANTYRLAQRQFDIGSASPDMPMDRMLLVLKRSREQEYALRTLLDNQQDKLSPQYHKWLMPDEFGVQFGPNDQDVQAVVGWLQLHGFQVNNVSHGRSVIEFSGTEGQVEEALHTAIHRYAINGQDHWANASDPQIPAALAPVVAGIWSLHDFRKKTRIQLSPKSIPVKYVPGARPDTNLTGPSGTIHALSPADYATIYSIGSVYAGGNTGLNTTIAVVGRSNLFSAGDDVRQFDSLFGCCAPNLQIVLNGPDPGDLGGGEEAEATLDATWAGSIAPTAAVKFVVSASTLTTDGVDLSAVYIIDNDLAPIMTESFSSCDTLATQGEADGISALAEQAAAEGITYIVSSGDSGAAGCDDPGSAPAIGGKAVNLLGTSFNIVVGGTQFNENGNNAKYWASQNANDASSALSYIPEVVWNESCLSCSEPNLFSTGGGVSTFFKPKPAWQSGVAGIPSDGARDQPDISLTAAGGHDPYLLCLEGSCVPDAEDNISIFLAGGTSASAPSFAGIMALVDSQFGPQGQANYVLYKLAASENFSQCNGSNKTTLPASTCVFNDVTSGTNSVPGQTGFSAGTGYDLSTGLGSVKVSNLISKWNSITFRGTTTTLGPSSVTTTHGMPVTLNVSVAPSDSGTGTPGGQVTLMTSNNQNVGFLTLINGSLSPSVDSLPGGTYTLTAQYAGDATFSPSQPSTPINVSVTPENSTTALSLFTADQSGNPIPFTGGPYGSFVYINADVQGQSGKGFPSGSLSLVDNSNSLGSLVLNSEGNTSTPNGYFGFTVGAHSLVAQYAGDSSFNGNSSAPATFTVSKASTTATLAPINGGVQGSSITLTANLASSAFTGFFGACTGLLCESSQFPTGSVTFSAGSTQLGTAPVTAGQFTGTGVTGSATLTTSALPSGQNSITAQYSGDANYQASSAAPISVGVEPDFTFAAGNASVSVSRGSSVTDSFTITGQTGYNGTINFTSASCSGLPSLSSCSFSPASVTGNGSTTLTVKTTAPTSAALHPFRWTGMGFVFAGVLLMGTQKNRLMGTQKNRRFTVGSMSVLLFCLALGSTGCGGGGNGGNGGGGGQPGTPTGSYTVVVTAATSDGVVSHAADFTLVVQ